MKKLLVLVIACALAVSLIAGCSGEEKSDVDTKIGVNVVETISTSVNHEFIIARGVDIHSGYIWREDYDKSMLELVESTIESNKQEGGRVVLSQVFRFKALKRGKTEITLVHRRQTLEGPLIANQEVISVNIE